MVSAVRLSQLNKSVFPLQTLSQLFTSILKTFAPRPAPIRILGALLLLFAVWVIPAVTLWRLGGATETAGTVVLVLIYGLFVLGLSPWARQVHGYPQPFQAYGLRFSRRLWGQIGCGLALGSAALALLIALEQRLGWLQLQPVPARAIFFAGLGVALPVGWAEELLFRGWILDELEQDYSLSLALVIDSFIYAALHYLKPWSEILASLPQFLGLYLLGVALVWAKRGQQGSLGLSIGLHAGLVWAYYVVDVGQWVRYTQAVPSWVTGINNNPLAGMAGLSILALLALGIRQSSTVLQPQKNAEQ